MDDLSSYLNSAVFDCDDCCPDEILSDVEAFTMEFSDHTMGLAGWNPNSPSWRAELVAETIVFFVGHGLCWGHSGALAQPLIESALNGIDDDGEGL